MTQDINERARAAVRNFRAMQHGLTAYARALSGNKKITVEVSTGAPRTDGNKIYYQPPLALADNLGHERRLCDKRDDNKKLICAACALREEVLSNIYHEIAHIAFLSFAEVSDYGKRVALEKGIQGLTEKRAEVIKKRINQADRFKKNTYQGLATLISPYLPFLLNCIEDARVDSSMCKVRPGVRVMLESSVYQIFSEGSEAQNGDRLFWADRPLNPQVGIACYLKAAGFHGWEQYLDEKVVKALDDIELNSYLAKVSETESALDTFELTFSILDRLKDLGFFKTEEDEEDDQPGTPGEGEEEEDSGDQGTPERSGQTDDKVPGDGSSESDEESGSSGTSGDPDSDENDSGSNPEPGEDDLNEDDSRGDDGDPDGEADEGQQGVGGRGSQDEESEHGDSGRDSQGDHPNSGDGDPDGDDSQSDGQEEASASDDSGTEDNADRSDDSDSSDSLGDEAGDSASVSNSSGLIDTGADQGKGGVEADDADYGTPEDVEGLIEELHNDHVAIEHNHETDPDENEAVKIAIVQGLYFERPAVGVNTVREHYYGKPMIVEGYRIDQGWAGQRYADLGFSNEQLGADVDLTMPESILGPALLKMRRVFTDNATAAHQHNLRSGRINKRVLGRRAWNDDDRLFTKKRLPGKKSYAVLIGIDISGSTIGVNLALAKRAAWAQAELCERTGVRFAIFAHSGSGDHGETGRKGLNLDMYHIKDFNQPWDKHSQEAFKAICSDSENLDGHSIEFYHKQIMAVDATDRIILYYSDGKMPAANYSEELEVLEREITACKRDGITLLGVGIRTDSPRRHGLSTVQVDSDEDLGSVVLHLEREMIRRAR